MKPQDLILVIAILTALLALLYGSLKTTQRSVDQRSVDRNSKTEEQKVDQCMMFDSEKAMRLIIEHKAEKAVAGLWQPHITGKAQDALSWATATRLWSNGKVIPVIYPTNIFRPRQHAVPVIYLDGVQYECFKVCNYHEVRYTQAIWPPIEEE